MLLAGGGGWNNYYPFESKSEDTKWRIPAHSDAELFTLLFQQEGTSILHVQCSVCISSIFDAVSVGARMRGAFSL